MIIHIGGAKGVGKTTVLSCFPKFTDCLNGISIITVSTLLANISGSTFGTPWPVLDESLRIKTRKLAIEHLISLKGAVLIDSHYIDLVDGRVITIMPEDFKPCIDVHVVIESDPRTILERRLKDRYRQRECDLDRIIREIRAEREVAISIAKEFGRPVHFVGNKVVGETCQEIDGILKRYIPENPEAQYETKIHHIERS